MAEIVIARHGETAWNAEGRFQGHADVPLNERGREQAEALAGRLAAGPPFDAAYSSDLRRAAETAGILAAGLGLTAVLDGGLREIDVGSWSGLTRDEIRQIDPQGFLRWSNGGELSHRGGETRAAFVARVHGSVLRIGVRHAGQRVLLVAHGGVIRALQRLVLGEPEPVLENCATWSFAVADGRLVQVGLLEPAAPTSSGQPVV